MGKVRRAELTVMSGIAILFVLLIHATGSAFNALYPELESFADSDVFLRAISNLAAPAVPIFIFLSGYKYSLNDTKTAYGKFLQKRLPRVLMSFFIINTIFWGVNSYIYMDSFNLILLLKTYISSWLGNTVAYPLWYIPMYCFVIIVCPVVMSFIKKDYIRFFFWLLIGCFQRYASYYVPTLGKYPFMFVSYPIFFELGFIVCKYGFLEKIKHKIQIVSLYFIAVILMSWLFPALSVSIQIKYGFYYILGTLIFYLAAKCLERSSFLLFLGVNSYPIFLLHEPVIGRTVGKILTSIGCMIPILYSICWAVITLVIAYGFERLLNILKVGDILWNFKMK